MTAIPQDPNGGAALLAYVGGTTGADDELAAGTYLSGWGLVVGYLGSLTLDPVADAADVQTVELAVLEVGAKLWDRRNAPGGQVSMDLDGTPARLAPVDPLTTAYPVLDRVLSNHLDSVSGLTFGGGFA